jgi:hypothetical protein
LRQFSVPFKVISVLFLLSGCTSIPVSSLITLSRIDFQTTRLQDLRVALELPDAIRPQTRGVMLNVEVSLGNAREKMEFRLEPAGGASEPKGLIAASSQGREIYTFKLSDKDVQTLEATRRRIMTGKEKGEKGSLGMGVAAREFCRAAALSEGSIFASTYIATSETGGYIPMLRNYDLRDDKTVAASLTHLNACT